MRFFVSIFDLAAMVIAEQAAITQAVVAFRPADPLAPTCIYAELAVHFWRMTNAPGNRTDWRVAVVTRNSTLRSIHRRTSIGDHARLETIVPAETFSCGTFHRFGDSTVPGATVFLDSASDLQRIPRPDFVVVDAPAYGMNACLDMGVPVMFVLRDLTEPRLLELATRIPTFAFSTQDIAAVPPDQRAVNAWIPKDQPGQKRLETLASGSTTAVHPVFADAAGKWFDQLWHDLPSVARASQHSSTANELLGLSYRRFYDLTHLVVPFEYYIRQFGSLESRIRSVASAAALAQGEAKDVYIPYVADELIDFARSLGNTPPKAVAFMELVRRLVGSAGATDVRVAALNIEIAQMLESWLEENMEEPPEVVALSALGRLDPTEHLILTGVPPTWGRRILCAGLASKVHVLAYTDSDGGSEAGVVRRMVSNFESDDKWLARSAAKKRCWSKVANLPCAVQDDQPSPPPPAVEEGFHEEAAVAPISLWSNLLGGTGAVHAARSGSDAVDVVKALRVTLTDGRWVLYGEDSNVTVLQEGHANDGLPAGNLNVGDVLVIIDSDPRKQLLDKLIEAGASVPEYAIVAELTQVFRVVVGVGYRQYGTYNALLGALQGRGSAITSVAAIRGWVTGKTIGPGDREDVRRVGEVVGNVAVATKHDRICEAITRMRGIRSKLSRRLGAMALRHGVDGVLGIAAEDELVDDVSGLTVGDFRSCIEYVKIAKIEHFGEAPVELSGSLHNPEENKR
ncbi:MAG: DISARM anti-phage system protein DrmE domain-containing protein [Vulcanimicrobiaceae bacterium]